MYGGQIVGYDGVDKRIDEIALVIKYKGTIYDLMKVEQAYAPPFSSAKDPVALCRIRGGGYYFRKNTTYLLAGIERHRNGKQIPAGCPHTG